MNKISEFEQIPDRPSLNFIPLNSAEELTLNGSINNSPQNLTIDSAFQTSQSLRIGGCGSSFSGNNSGTGYYRYPIDTINAASTVEGSLITVTVNALQLPNRFTITDSITGNIVAASPWMGTANFAGPWGEYVEYQFQWTIDFQSFVIGKVLVAY